MTNTQAIPTQVPTYINWQTSPELEATPHVRYYPGGQHLGTGICQFPALDNAPQLQYTKGTPSVGDGSGHPQITIKMSSVRRTRRFASRHTRNDIVYHIYQIQPQYGDEQADAGRDCRILRRERGRGNIHFSCSADHERDWPPYPVDHFLLYVCASIPAVIQPHPQPRKKCTTGSAPLTTPL